jgi:hypothetical protein
MAKKLYDRHFLFGWNFRKKEWLKSFVARFSHGSILLQLARFMTRGEYEELRQRSLSYDFN